MLSFAILLFALPEVVTLRSDLHRFPGVEVCEEAIMLSRAQGKWIERCQLFAPESLWRDWQPLVKENERRAMVWDLLRDAQRDREYRFHYLCRLRELLGDDDYFDGRMPAPLLYLVEVAW